MWLQCLFFLLHLLCACWLLVKLPFFNCRYNIRLVLIFFIGKVAIGLLHYYMMIHFQFGGDALSFFNTGIYLNTFAFNDTWMYFKIMIGFGYDANQIFAPEMYWTNADILFNDNQTLIRMHALLAFISMHNFAVHTIWFSFFCCIGFVSLIKAVQLFFGKNHVHTMIITCIPSVFFWCGGCSKESVLIALLGWFMLSLTKTILYNKISIQFMLSYAALFLIKSYFALALIPALIALYCSLKHCKKVWLTFTTVYAAVFFVIFWMPGFSLIDYLKFKQHSFQYLAEWSGAGSIVSLIEIKSPLQLLPNALQALEHVFLRPNICEIKNAFWLFAAFENYILLIIACLFIVGYKNFSINLPTFFLLFFALSLLVLIGITTPVLGSLVRYKAPLLPFIYIAIAWQYNATMFNKRFKRILT